jgi:hypothetical protein
MRETKLQTDFPYFLARAAIRMLFEHADEWFQLRQLVRRTGLSPGAAHAAHIRAAISSESRVGIGCPGTCRHKPILARCSRHPSGLNLYSIATSSLFRKDLFCECTVEAFANTAPHFIAR